MESFTINLDEILQGAQEQARQRTIKQAGPVPILEARLMEMRAALERYEAGCPFKVGDLVTPRKSSHLRHAGKPHLVVEVLKDPLRHWSGESSMPEFGAKFDMRVIAYNDVNNILSWTSESWLFEQWFPEMETEAKN